MRETRSRAPCRRYGRRRTAFDPATMTPEDDAASIIYEADIEPLRHVPRFRRGIFRRPFFTGPFFHQLFPGRGKCEQGRDLIARAPVPVFPERPPAPVATVVNFVPGPDRKKRLVAKMALGPHSARFTLLGILRLFISYFKTLFPDAGGDKQGMNVDGLTDLLREVI